MSPRRIATAALGLALAGLGGCHLEMRREHPLGCRMDEQALIRDTFYFGRSIPGGGHVSDADWDSFEAGTLAPAFPKGYTVLDGHGRWQGDKGEAVGEDSRLVIVLHPDDGASGNAVKHVADAYKQRFRQESVLREAATVCAKF
jgi:hypothetical protein